MYGPPGSGDPILRLQLACLPMCHPLGGSCRQPAGRPQRMTPAGAARSLVYEVCQKARLHARVQVAPTSAGGDRKLEYKGGKEKDKKKGKKR